LPACRKSSGWLEFAEFEHIPISVFLDLMAILRSTPQEAIQACLEIGLDVMNSTTELASDFAEFFPDLHDQIRIAGLHDSVFHQESRIDVLREFLTAEDGGLAVCQRMIGDAGSLFVGNRLAFLKFLRLPAFTKEGQERVADHIEAFLTNSRYDAFDLCQRLSLAKLDALALRAVVPNILDPRKMTSLGFTESEWFRFILSMRKGDWVGKKVRIFLEECEFGHERAVLISAWRYTGPRPMRTKPSRTARSVTEEVAEKNRGRIIRIVRTKRKDLGRVFSYLGWNLSRLQEYVCQVFFFRGHSLFHLGRTMVESPENVSQAIFSAFLDPLVDPAWVYQTVFAHDGDADKLGQKIRERQFLHHQFPHSSLNFASDFLARVEKGKVPWVLISALAIPVGWFLGARGGILESILQASS
jgi:hypothetical protein